MGRATFFIQNDPRSVGQELFCTLNSLQPNEKWPFVNLETLPADADETDDLYEWGRYRMLFGDDGCMYFMIDENGKVTWVSDCY